MPQSCSDILFIFLQFFMSKMAPFGPNNSENSVTQFAATYLKGKQGDKSPI